MWKNATATSQAKNMYEQGQDVNSDRDGLLICQLATWSSFQTTCSYDAASAQEKFFWRSIK